MNFRASLGPLVLLVWCIFMGVTAISIGFGALFPPLDRVAQPFVCPGGQMTYTETVYRPSPGTTITQIQWYCVDNRTGERTELGIFPKALYAGTLYGLLLFGIIWIVYRWNSGRQTPAPVPTVAHPTAPDPYTPAADESFHTSAAEDRRARRLADERARIRHEAEQRLKDIKEMLAANTITQAEYEQKRAEILKDL